MRGPQSHQSGSGRKRRQREPRTNGQAQPDSWLSGEPAVAGEVRVPGHEDPEPEADATGVGDRSEKAGGTGQHG